MANPLAATILFNAALAVRGIGICADDASLMVVPSGSGAAVVGALKRKFRRVFAHRIK
jgi:hypothetical protein